MLELGRHTSSVLVILAIKICIIFAQVGGRVVEWLVLFSLFLCELPLGSTVFSQSAQTGRLGQLAPSDWP